jgi:AraC family transcriptional regulator
LILREMPATWDPGFRPSFYARWGRENCIISALTRQCQYPLFKQRLSIKAAWGGHEDYFVDHRRVAVDDDSFLIMNDERTYGSEVRSRTPITSFAIFFRPNMVPDTLRTLTTSPERLLEDPFPARPTSIEFSERLRPHDRSVSPVLRFIRHHVEAGVDDEAWYEEQLFFLLTRMLALHRKDLSAEDRVPASRPATRRELHRRVSRGADFIHTHFAKPIGLEEIAAAARLSPYHCLRMFKAVQGCTPREFLARKRMSVAERLLCSTALPLHEVAALVGFRSRSTLFRKLRASGERYGARRVKTLHAENAERGKEC